MQKDKMREKKTDKAGGMLHNNFPNLCVHVFFSGSNFVTRKISRSVAKIHLGQLQCFSLGNLDSKRDWGHAKDYVEVLSHTQTFDLQLWGRTYFTRFSSMVHCVPTHCHIVCMRVNATLNFQPYILFWNVRPLSGHPTLTPKLI